jgi:peptide deformylase
VLVNPEIIFYDGTSLGREGCLSVPSYTGRVQRAKSIVLKAHDVNGEQHEFRMSGYEARAVQHEIDHLDGKLFLDRLVNRRNALTKRTELSL